MSRDLPLAESDAWMRDDAEVPSALDRTIDLPIAVGRWMVVALALVLGGLLRFLDLNRWPMSAQEAEIAETANNLVHGANVPDSLLGIPTTIQWIGLFLFSGGTTEVISRIAVATAGVVALLFISRFARWVGPLTAVGAALFVATSPTLIAASRRVDGGILLVTLSIALIGCLLLSYEQRGLVWPALSGVSAALLFLSDPLGLPAILLAGLAVYLIARPEESPRRDPLLIGVASALGTLVIVSTVFLTQPQSFAASIGENFSLLWNEHISQAGDQFYMPAFNLLLNEPLLIVLALVAVVAAPQRALVRALGIWTVESFILISILGAVELPGYTLTVLPLTVLAGLGAAHLYHRVPWQEIRRGPAAIFVLAVLLAAAAALAVFGMVTSGAGTDRAEWLLEFGLVVAVGVLPLAWTISWLGQRLVGDRALLTLLAVLVILGALGVRSAVLTASVRTGLPGEPTSAGAISPSVQLQSERINRLSRDMTNAMRDSQDPGGGHGLIIAIDAAVAQPFAWYFRDYPNVTIFDPDVESPPTEAQIVLLSGTRDPRAVAPTMRGARYPYAFETPEFYTSPDWGSLLSGIIHPSDWRTFADFILDRDFATDPPLQEFQLLATPDLATRLFPASGPFSLDDRPGAGTGDGQFSRPRGIAVAADGTIYVVDSRNVRVEMFDASGQYLAQFGVEGSGPGQFARFPGAGGGGPGGIAIGADGSVYVADTWNHRVQVFNAAGAFQFSWGSFFDAQDDPNASNASPGQFYGPRDVAIHDDLVYVTDTGNERVQVFTTTGEFVRMFGLTGSEDGQLLEPVGIAVGNDGTVYVADSHNARIARFSSDGTWLDPWPVVEWTGQRFFEPYLELGLDGTLYASTSPLGSVLVFSPDGEPLPALVAPELRQPFGLALTPDGSELLVTDSTLNAVVRVPLTP